MAQQVGPLVWGLEIGARQRPADDGANRAAIAEATPRCAQTQEQLPCRTAGPRIVQVMAEGLPDVPRQRKALDTAALATDDQFPCLPIHVFQPQGGHFVGPQAQTGKQQHNRVITPALWALLVDGLQQALDIFRRHVLGQS